jgi:hypothetical protein
MAGKPDLPILASLPPFVPLRYFCKVAGMKTPNEMSHEAVEEFKAIYKEDFWVDKDEWLEWPGRKRK